MSIVKIERWQAARRLMNKLMIEVRANALTASHADRPSHWSSLLDTDLSLAISH